MFSYLLPAFISFWIMFAMRVTSQKFFNRLITQEMLHGMLNSFIGWHSRKLLFERFSSDSVCALLVHVADFHFSNMEPLISQLGHGIMHQRAMVITGNGSNQIFSAPVRLPDHRHLGITSICVASLLCSANITQKYWLLYGPQLTHAV